MTLVNLSETEMVFLVFNELVLLMSIPNMDKFFCTQKKKKIGFHQRQWFIRSTKHINWPDPACSATELP